MRTHPEALPDPDGLLHRQAVLLQPLPAEGLRAGEFSGIVRVYPGGRHLEVEFINADGDTQAVLTLPSDQLLPLQRAVPLGGLGR